MKHRLSIHNPIRIQYVVMPCSTIVWEMSESRLELWSSWLIKKNNTQMKSLQLLNGEREREREIKPQNLYWLNWWMNEWIAYAVILPIWSVISNLSKYYRRIFSFLSFTIVFVYVYERRCRLCRHTHKKQNRLKIRIVSFWENCLITDVMCVMTDSENVSIQCSSRSFQEIFSGHKQNHKNWHLLAIISTNFYSIFFVVVVTVIDISIWMKHVSESFKNWYITTRKHREKKWYKWADKKYRQTLIKRSKTIFLDTGFLFDFSFFRVALFLSARL